MSIIEAKAPVVSEAPPIVVREAASVKVPPFRTTITRAEAVACAEEAIAVAPELSDEQRDELMRVAETAPRFAVDTWYRDENCGCLVGWYLGESANRRQYDGRSEILDDVGMEFYRSLMKRRIVPMGNVEVVG